MDQTIGLESLGQRIVAAARLAVAMHLYQAVDPNQKSQQRAMIGGAGPRLTASGETPASNRPIE